MTDALGVLATFSTGAGRTARFHSLPALEAKGFGRISRLPVSLRIVLESLVRNLDGHRVREEDVRALASWRPSAERSAEIPFVVSRVLLQDFTGVPLLVDLAAMRAAVARLGKDPKLVEPLVPVDLVVDHSVQVDAWGTPAALRENMQKEFERNRERYAFLKWGTQAFERLRIVPPGIGICHQVNLEFLATVATERDGLFLYDTLLGTDSHTTMVNGIGVVGWGVGGIEAEAAMLGQPASFLTPDVVGVHVHGRLPEGSTGTDVVLAVTELLRRHKVVGKFVEFHGEGASSLPAAERATIANMAPEYGATIGFFPPDDETLRYLRDTGRPAEQVEAVRAYLSAQGTLGIPRRDECDYSEVVDLDLARVEPAVAGPKRPQDRIPLSALSGRFAELFSRTDPTGYGKPAAELGVRKRRGAVDAGHGDVVIAAITSCTNTSNPAVMLAAGLLARKAAERGMRPPPTVKTSLAPGSRVVTRYLERTGLLRHLDALGFDVVGYGCTTCIGNSGPLDPDLERLVTENDLVVASVLSGNRNFEARIHGSVKANFLMSPPLVVAFALAGTVAKDITREPLGRDRDGRDVYLRDLWPSPAEVASLLSTARDPEEYRKNYERFDQNPQWNEMRSAEGLVYRWDPKSTYVQEPPYFMTPPRPPSDVTGARALAIFGDSVTTDHISPAGSIRPSSPAGQYLVSLGVAPADFNSYGSRRGNDRVMVRGTFANVRIRNLMVPGVEGGVTSLQPSGERMSIYDAAVEYEKRGVPLVVLAGQEYGTGSSRDWAAKGTALLGVRAVVARSFERIHRANLAGMGVLPCQFPDGVSAEALRLDGTETYDLLGVSRLAPRATARLVVRRRDGRQEEVPVLVRLDTPVEVEFLRAGGILPHVMAKIAG
ncbi:MAG TPA: aconitate hydratase AcnA [Anaeromyxobacteraceae bacterium]|nr:aconitate hydratase AcnA [Anaeromyxobacteraceae bacterium]